VVIDYGSFMARMRQMRYPGLARLLVDSVSEMAKGAKSIQQNPYLGKTAIDQETLEELEAYAYELGVADIGYTKVNSRYIFKGYQILFPNAIVFTIEMDKAKIKQAPSMPSFVEIFRTYHQIGVIVNLISDFLRERGFNAHAGPAVGGDLNYIPLARDAGLGEVGKNGLLITKNNGPRIRLAAVYTDIENLPFAQGYAHQWVYEYCQNCNICIEKCPADAYFPEPILLPDGGHTYIDHTKCADPFSNDNGCTLCIKYCAFSYGVYDKIKADFQTAQQESAT
jgi:ferredoxin